MGASTPQGGREVGKQGLVTALVRGLELLRAFGPGEDLLGNAELARRTGIPKPTVSRLTATLTALGYLRYSERLEKYQLGPAVLALGFRYLASMGVRTLARPYMQELADWSEWVVALGVEDGLHMTYIETCQGSGPLHVRTEVGYRVPVASSAMGRAYLAALDEAQREQYFERLRAFHGAQWPRLERELRQALRDYASKGFCISVGEWDRTVSGVGVPLLLEGSSEVLAFNCGGPSRRLSREKLENELGPRLVEMVAKVRAALSGEPAATT